MCEPPAAPIMKVAFPSTSVSIVGHIDERGRLPASSVFGRICSSYVLAEREVDINCVLIKGGFTGGRGTTPN